MQKNTVGVLCILLSALCFSIGGICVKLVPWSALSINGARSLLSAALIGLYLWKTGHKIRVNKSTLLGACCICATTTLYVFANKLTTAANAIVLQFTAPVFIILFMWLFFRERPKKLDVAACAAVLCGICCFFVDSLSSGGMLGNVLAILSGVAYAGVFLLKTIPGGDSFSSIVLGQLLSAVIGLPFLPRETVFSAAAVGGVLALGLIQMGLAYLFFARGIDTTPPVTASLVCGIEPILNPVWVALFWGERIGPTAFLGAVIVIGSILIYNIQKAKQTKTA